MFRDGSGLREPGSVWAWSALLPSGNLLRTVRRYESLLWERCDLRWDGGFLLCAGSGVHATWYGIG